MRGSFSVSRGLRESHHSRRRASDGPVSIDYGKRNHDNKIATLLCQPAVPRHPHPAAARRTGRSLGRPGQERQLGRHRQRPPDHRRRPAVRHGHPRPALEPAGPGQRRQRVQAGAGLVLLLRRREAARPGIPGHRQRRGDLRHRLLFAGVRPRRQDRQAPVDLQPPPARRHPPLLRRGQPWRGHLRRQDLLRHPGRPRGRPRQEDRQGGLEQEIWRPRRGLHHDRCADHREGRQERQGAADPRQFRR
ncbi:hypothetical protein D3C80_565370 [compost metagenome]